MAAPTFQLTAAESRIFFDAVKMAVNDGNLAGLINTVNEWVRTEQPFRLQTAVDNLVDRAVFTPAELSELDQPFATPAAAAAASKRPVVQKQRDLTECVSRALGQGQFSLGTFCTRLLADEGETLSISVDSVYNAAFLRFTEIMGALGESYDFFREVHEFALEVQNDKAKSRLVRAAVNHFGGERIVGEK